MRNYADEHRQGRGDVPGYSPFEITAALFRDAVVLGVIGAGVYHGLTWMIGH